MLGRGISAENTRIDVSGTTAKISFGGNSTDEITIDFSAGPLSVSFTDGTRVSLGGLQIVEPAPPTINADDFVASFYREH